MAAVSGSVGFELVNDDGAGFMRSDCVDSAPLFMERLGCSFFSKRLRWRARNLFSLYPLNEIESFSCKVNEYPNEDNHTRLSVRSLSDQLRKISIVAKGSMNAKPILAKTSSKLGVIALRRSDPSRKICTGRSFLQ